MLTGGQVHQGEEGAVRYRMGYVWIISLVAAMGGLLFGYDWVVIGGAKPFLEKFFELNNEQQVGWANSCALVGCLLGSLFTGGLSDRCGRKKLLIAAALLFMISSILTGWAATFDQFVLWRISGGIAIGMASNLSPVYIAEIAPTFVRGRLVAINQLTIVMGIVAAQSVNWIIAQPVPDLASAEFIRSSWNGQYAWRWMFTAVAVPSLVFFLGAIFIPESPRWLVKRGFTERARDILEKIGGRRYADSQVLEIQKSHAAKEEHDFRFREILRPKPAKILMVGITLAVLQQWSGINVIFNYAEEIYRSAGYGLSEILFNIVITGAINLVFTLLAIGTVDRLGRRFLMLLGCAGIALSHLLIGTAYILALKGLSVLLFTLCALGCYALSLAPITWVLISEIFPNRIRGTAVSIAVSALWIACFILTYTFPLLNRALGTAGTFWLYSTICAAGFLFVFFFVPETRDKSLEQIEHELWGSTGPSDYRS